MQRTEYASARLADAVAETEVPAASLIKANTQKPKPVAVPYDFAGVFPQYDPHSPLFDPINMA